MLKTEGFCCNYVKNNKKKDKTCVVYNLLITFVGMTKEKTQIKQGHRIDMRKPKHYKVIIYNDDFTTMDFVVMILQQVFGKELSEAEELMLTIHHKGEAVVGTYSLDIAKSKVCLATRMAREANFPLTLGIMEE